MGSNYNLNDVAVTQNFDVRTEFSGKEPLNKGPGVVRGHVHVDRCWPGLEIGRGMPTWAGCHDKSKMLGYLASLKSQLYFI